MEKRTHDQEFAEMIVAKLKEGTTPWQKGWSINEALAKPFHNVISDKPYHGANIVRLWFACEKNGYLDHRFVTYKQAQEKGWQVRKGEKGTYISFYKPILKECKNADTGENETVSYFALKGYTVFNAAQIDGIDPLPEPAKYIWDPIELGERILANSSASIEHKITTLIPSYNSLLDTISMPVKSYFKNAAEYYSAAIHELAHWTGASNRLDRKLTNKSDKTEYAREELRAEIASWMISTATGLPFSPDNHAAYVASWIQTIKNDYREIFRACSDAERIKDYILAYL